MIDSHCHLADEVFAGDLDAVVSRAIANGVAGALCILDASEDEELVRAHDVATRWPAVRFGIGVHPHRASRCPGGVDETVARTASGLDTVAGSCALGEIGLDYHYDFAPRDVQQQVFAAQLDLARRRGVPVVIHTREADEDVLRIIAEAGRGDCRGVFHCFTGGMDLARSALDLGFHVSLSGIVTFPRAQALRDVARFVPDDRLLVETDSPYLAPVPHRGKRNEPGWVTRVAEVVAEVRGTSRETIDALTTANFEALFGAGRGRGRVDSPGGLC
jgi:TatD DNase family protein